jgi:flagellar motor switch protein FliM
MIDRLPGRSGLQLPKARSMTEIERSIMQNVLKLLVDKLKESWRPVYPLDFVLTAIEAHPHMVQVTSPNENVIHFQFHARKGENASFPMGSLLSLQVGDTLVLDQREHWPVIIKVSSKTKFHVRRQMDSMRKAFGIIGHIRPRREESGNGYISQ